MTDATEKRPFVWTFPLYILAAGYVLEPDGSFSFDEETWYVAPDFGNEPHLVIFTDAHSAERYRAACNADREIRAFGFGPEQMLRLLEAIGPSFPKIVIDPNLAVRTHRSAPTSELIDGIKAYLSGQIR